MTTAEVFPLNGGDDGQTIRYRMATVPLKQTRLKPHAATQNHPASARTGARSERLLQLAAFPFF